jgi:hypothetical protein
VAAALPLPLLGVDVLGVDVLAVGVLAVAVGVLAVAVAVAVGVGLVVVVTFETSRALSVSFCASKPTTVAPTAAPAVSPAVATATRRRPRSLAFTLPPASRSSGTGYACVPPTFESLPVRDLWLNRELLQVASQAETSFQGFGSLHR